MGREASAVKRELKVPVVNRREYTIKLERSDNKTFIHCDVYVPWSKTVKERLAEDFNTLKSLHRDYIYALHDPDDRKHKKFLSMFGFKYHDIFSDQTGRHRHIYST